MKLLPYQRTGVEWLRKHARTGLYDDQGLGKTVQAAAAIEQLGLGRVLVVAPTSVLYNWQRELATWAGLDSVVLRERTDRPPAGGGVIVSHGMLVDEDFTAALRDARFDLLVVDEAHAFVHPQAKRAAAMFLGRDALCRSTPRTWLLTGTPMPNDATELWLPLAGIAPERLRHNGKLLTFDQWRDRFCVTRRARAGRTMRTVVVGLRTENAAELRKRVAGFALRRLKKDVLNLPPLRTGYITVTLEEPGLLQGPPGLDEFAAAFDGAPVDEVVPVPKSIMEWRRKVATAKAWPLAELLSDELDADPRAKVVVAAEHLDAIAQLARVFTARGMRPVSITGATSASERAAVVDQFQTDNHCRVFLGQITAAGVGITLTAADSLVFLEQSFSPGKNAQMRDRIYRIGQSRPVLIRYAVAPGSSDELVSRVLARKSDMVRQVMQ